jgi:hypothetical protein
VLLDLSSRQARGRAAACPPEGRFGSAAVNLIFGEPTVVFAGDFVVRSKPPVGGDQPAEKGPIAPDSARDL